MNSMKIEIESNMDNVAIARVAIATYVANMNVTVDELMDVKTAVSEAITNSIVHGYENTSGKIIMDVLSEGRKLSITITDYGKGIEDISLATTPAYTSKPELEHAGMGFTIMESFMDELIIDSTLNEGTKITLKKEFAERKQE